MKIALAQIDARLGDIEGICARIEQQAHLAAEQGARLLCTPFPLFTGVNAGGLLESPNFEHSMVRALGELSERLASTDITCLVPATVNYLDAPLFELFMLKDGRLIPTRSMLAQRREAAAPIVWTPPVFDVAGVRIAATFDLEHDIEEVPTGCDLVISFQVNAFDASDETTAAVAAIERSRVPDVVSRKGVWLAWVAPVGGFDEVVYTGGSFVMDDIGRVVAAAPCFEESLLVQDVHHGTFAIEDEREPSLPGYSRNEWIWGALRISLRDSVRASGREKVALVLSNDLSSSLLCALCVDALGPRNVIGLIVDLGASASQRDSDERSRAESIRAFARNLHIQLVERTGASAFGRDASSSALSGDMMRAGQITGVLLDEVAQQADALAVSPISKTDAALAAPLHAARYEGMVAPFGDVYLTTLEFLAKERNRLAPTIPEGAVNLRAVKQSMAEILVWMVVSNRDHPEYRERMAQVLTALEPHEIDAVLEAHVDRSCPFEEIPQVEKNPEAVALLLMFVRGGESARRMLPMAPIISARSFVERDWPRSLAWSDMGRNGDELLSAHDIAVGEIEGIRSRAARSGERMRGEIMGLVGGLFGLTPEQVEELSSAEGQQRMRESFEHFESQIQDAINRMADSDDGHGGPGGTQTPPTHPPSDPSSRNLPFFSQN
ncbi:hypothetical protein Corgl_1163 [Coriobacterium glomerans PW2]|uniref:NAD/GMP synthase domain-containing protein n=1 Tax=Coriobacterium glomerans (strain ATCC 49209 / DSM 20642 / JCM 10262 / PW2) TaxID=700015 RepID=F2N886_CORGP|nr:hypothetical protein [Coriobacterium glomerans]AEB07269.1 hypothetical protein Corgl_1163 [Coriobacterium glomerans PW2]